MIVQQILLVSTLGKYREQYEEYSYWWEAFISFCNKVNTQRERTTTIGLGGGWWIIQAPYIINLAREIVAQ